MSTPLDALETRSTAQREEAQGRQLAALLHQAAASSAFWRERLANVEPGTVGTDALTAVPVLRKSELPALQKAAPPFGGLAGDARAFTRLFLSPGPICEPQPTNGDAWGAASGFRAAGLSPGGILLNTFGYHLTPGGFIMDEGARALGCAVIPAGPGNTEQQVQAISLYRPDAYAGTADFLNILLTACSAAGVEWTIRRAVCSGAAAPRSLREAFAERGMEVFEFYATAELGVIAYETAAHDGLVVGEDMLVELLELGSGRPVEEGEIGEVVVTRLDPSYPLIRFATGDLSRTLAGPSPCGRTNMRLAGWLGRADETAKVKGMFVHAGQIRQIVAGTPVTRARLVVTRRNERDLMTLEAECAEPDEALTARLSEALRAATRLSGEVQLLAPGTMDADPRTIIDRRTYD